MSYSHKELKELTERVREGYLSATDAAETIGQLGGLMIGTAQSAEGYLPRIPLTSQPNNGAQEHAWKVYRTTEDHAIIPVVRALSVSKLAIWTAFGGDTNHALQRQAIGKSFLPEDKQYEYGTYGYFNSGKDYALRAHRDFLLATNTMSDDEIIGAIDVIDNPQSSTETFSIYKEPGQFGVVSPTERVASMPVRMADVRELTGITPYYYEPRQLS